MLVPVGEITDEPVEFEITVAIEVLSVVLEITEFEVVLFD